MPDYPAKPPKRLHVLLPAPARLPFIPSRKKNWAPGAMKVFASQEVIENNQHNYRYIYDVSELTFVNLEFTLYNRLADIKAWQFSCVIKCFDYYGDVVCTQSCSLQINPDQNIVYVREGWGSDKPGGFWVKGTYTWAIYVDNELVDSVKFYVNDLGSLKAGTGAEPYFAIQHLKFFEASDELLTPENRQYTSVFDARTVRYIWFELQATNLLANQEIGWAAELFFRFYLSNGVTKATLHTFTNQAPGQTLLTTEMGWGNKLGKAWAPGTYKLDVLFMNRRLASYSFEVKEE